MERGEVLLSYRCMYIFIRLNLEAQDPGTDTAEGAGPCVTTYSLFLYGRKYLKYFMVQCDD
jgi:hypothetical protein